jgi:3-phosphoshikimate 1-carboxyvinyltransferase
MVSRQSFEREISIDHGGPVDMVVDVPGSKSIANRALVLAAMADGASILTNVPAGDDVEAMANALGSLGSEISGGDGVLTVAGSVDFGTSGAIELDARLAGTTSRFLIALASLRVGRTTVSGEGRLRERPFGELVGALRSLGADVEGGPGLPISVQRGNLRGGAVTMSGAVSSQFVSALMMIGPLLDGGLRIELSGDVVSSSYISMTAKLMTRFGANVRFDGRTVEVEEGRYRATTIDIEPDASSASYPAALAAIAGGSVRIRRAATIEMQSDRVIFDILRQMGVDVSVQDGDMVIERESAEALRGVDVNLRDSSDLVPTVAVVASRAIGRTRIRGVGFVRNKESDRIGDLASELRKFGVTVTEEGDGLDVVGSPVAAATIEPHHDHRLAMALSLLGRVAEGTKVSDPAVVSKSWPGFFADMGLVS